MKNRLFTTFILPTLLILMNSSLLLFAPPLPGPMPQQNGLPQMSPQEMQAFDQELQRLLEDPQAMQEMAEFAEKLMAEDPEFKKLVEDMTVEMENQFKQEGIDLNQFAPQPTAPVEAPAQPIEQPKIETPAKPVISKKTIKEIKNILETIADKLANVRQKALDDTAFKKMYEPWQFYIDDLIYYANVLMEDALIKHLTEKEFEKLYKNLKEFARILDELEPGIEPKEFNLDQQDPYSILDLPSNASFEKVETTYYTKLQQHKAPAVIESQMKAEGRDAAEIAKAKKQAAQERSTLECVYNQIRSYEESKENLKKLLEFDIQTLVHTQNIFDLIKKLLAAHEPEALKIRQEKEKEEAESRKKQEETTRRFPPYSPPTYYTPPFSQYPGSGGYQDYYPPYQDSYTPLSTQSTPAEQAIKLDEKSDKKTTPAGKKNNTPAKKEKESAVQDKTKKPTAKKDSNPQVEIVIELLKKDLEIFENELEKKIGASNFTPEELFQVKEFKDTIKSKDTIKIPVIKNSLTELTSLINTAKKSPTTRMAKLTFAQKTEIQKKGKDILDAFEKKLASKVPALQKLTEDPLTKKIKIEDQDIPLDEAKEFLRSYTELKKQIGVATPSTSTVPPAPPVAPVTR